MSFYKFNKDDLILAKIATHPYYTVELNGNRVTGSVYLEREYLENSLRTRLFKGFSEKEGGLTEKHPPFTASIDIIQAVSGGTNNQFFESLKDLYRHHSLYDGDYRLEYNGSTVNNVRVVTIPEIYYDKEVLSSSFTASDKDSAGNDRFIYDNGRGGLYSGSLTGTLVGNIFYSEGFAVLTKPDLNNFGGDSPTNFFWKVQFKGTHYIPCMVMKCTAPAGQLNASTNPTFYVTPSSGDYKNSRKIVHTGSVYITSVGIFNDDFELVAIANLAQPIRKRLDDNLLFRIRMDF